MATEVEGCQAAVCLSWHPRMKQMENNEPLVLPSKGWNINSNVQQHLTSSPPGGGEASIQRDQSRGQAGCESVSFLSFGLSYLEVMLAEIYLCGSTSQKSQKSILN